MKPPFWTTILTLAGLAVLCGLGTWQVQRLHWKTALLSQLESEYAKDPMTFELTAENLDALPPDRTFVRGFAEGVYRHKDEIALGPRTFEGRPGYHIITPFETLDNHIILVNRGWVPLDKRTADFARPAQPLIVRGTARKPDTGNMFTPQNNPAQDEWYRLDPWDIATAKSLSGILSYVLYAEEDYKLPLSVATQWRPRNSHLGYALFWFTLAGVLLVIYYLRFFRSK